MMMQSSVCGVLVVAALCVAVTAAPRQWRENVVYRTTAGKAEPAIMLPGIPAPAVAPAPTPAPPVVQTQVTSSEPANPTTLPTTPMPALNKGTVSALQSTRVAPDAAHVAAMATAPESTPRTVPTAAPAVVPNRSLNTASKAVGVTRVMRGGMRRVGALGTDQFVDRNNDGYDDRSSAADL
jgi:hypothetical protein